MWGLFTKYAQRDLGEKFPVMNTNISRAEREFVLRVSKQVSKK